MSTRAGRVVRAAAAAASRTASGRWWRRLSLTGPIPQRGELCRLPAFGVLHVATTNILTTAEQRICGGRGFERLRQRKRRMQRPGKTLPAGARGDGALGLCGQFAAA